MKLFPTADQVALAVVTAARLTGEDPVAIGERRSMTARAYVYAGLRAAYPECTTDVLGRLAGYSAGSAARGALIICRQSDAWCDEWVDEIVGALVADDYGERAA